MLNTFYEPFGESNISWFKTLVQKFLQMFYTCSKIPTNLFLTLLLQKQFILANNLWLQDTRKWKKIWAMAASDWKVLIGVNVCCLLNEQALTKYVAIREN